MITDPIYLEGVGQYADLARRYADAPFGQREGSSVEPELSRLEELLAAEPPRVEKSPGLWTPRPKGLHPRSLAERKADEFYGPPLAARVEGGHRSRGPGAQVDLSRRHSPPGRLAGQRRPVVPGGLQDRLPTPQGEARQFRRIPQADWQRPDHLGRYAGPCRTANPFRWVGQVGYYFDDLLATFYVRARVYDPTTGRWLSQDPLFYPAARQRVLLGTGE